MERKFASWKPLVGRFSWIVMDLAGYYKALFGGMVDYGRTEVNLQFPICDDGGESMDTMDGEQRLDYGDYAVWRAGF